MSKGKSSKKDVARQKRSKRRRLMANKNGHESTKSDGSTPEPRAHKSPSPLMPSPALAKNNKASSPIIRALKKKRSKRQRATAAPGLASNFTVNSYVFDLDPIFVKEPSSDQLETDGVPWLIDEQGLPLGLLFDETAIIAYKPRPLHLFSAVRGMSFLCEYMACELDGETTEEEPSLALEVTFLDNTGKGQSIKTNPLVVRGMDVYDVPLSPPMINALRLFRCSLKVIPMSGHPIMLAGSWLRIYV